MSNLWNLFSDQEDKYQNWLRNSAAPSIKSWYDKSGIDERLQQAQTGLLGTPEWDPSGTKRVGGAFGEGGSLSTAGGQVADYFQGEKVFDPATGGPTKRTGVYSSKSMEHFDKGIEKFDDVIKWATPKVENVFDKMFPNANKNISTDAKKRIITENMKTDPFGADKRGQQPGFTDQDASSLAKFAGVNLKDAAKKFKDKGGFEGLMSNPAFTLGLALMQSSAQGKNIGQGVLDNFVKAAGISDHYKDRIQARKDRLEAKGEVIGPPSEAEMGVVERVLESKNFKTKFGVGAFLSKHLFGKDKEKQYHSTVSAIAAKVNAKSAADAAKGKKVQITEDYVLSIVNEMIDKGELKKGEGVTEGVLSGAIFEMRPELTKMAEGGPVEAGQPYLVGEKGPEVVVPNTDATVVSNDDSQVMSMLLSSNPQLQNVSRTRAESILRSRFPDYFA
jgi:hypothetical protein